MASSDSLFRDLNHLFYSKTDRNRELLTFFWSRITQIQTKFCFESIAKSIQSSLGVVFLASSVLPVDDLRVRLEPLGECSSEDGSCARWWPGGGDRRVS